MCANKKYKHSATYSPDLEIGLLQSVHTETETSLVLVHRKIAWTNAIGSCCKQS
jgi:hypothetical protein